MLYRPESWSEVLGNKNIVDFFLNHSACDTLPNFILIFGPPGIGKTTIAKLAPLYFVCEESIKPCYKCPSCLEHINEVIRGNRDTTYTISRKMTVDGTKEKTREIVELFNDKFIEEGKHKFIILDEAHRMSQEAQDEILIDTEYLPKNVHVIMLTTDLNLIREGVLSRAVCRYLKPLSQTDMITILERETHRRKLIIEQSKLAFNIILSWAEYKPRKALKVLESMGENRTVKITEVQDYVSYLGAEEFLPLLSGFVSESFLLGMEAIMNLNFDPNSKRFLVDFLIDVIKLKNGVKRVNLSTTDALKIKELIQPISSETLGLFLSGISRLDSIDNMKVLGEYLKVHPSLNKLVKRDLNSMNEDNLYKSMHGHSHTEELNIDTKRQKNLDRMERGGIIVGEMGDIPTLSDLIKK